jgi:RecA/RadA recombinase
LGKIFNNEKENEMSKLMDRMIKNTKLVGADVLSDSKLFSEKEVIQTDIPAINIALSGDLDGGLRPGLTTIAGLSRHFKSSYALLMAGAYMKKHPDGMILFYDSEFGANADYFTSFGIDPNSVLHIPIMNIEELTFDLSKKLDTANDDGIKRGDKIFILVDSVGNLASKKEADNAVDGHGATDMGLRAKSLKSFYRIITPHLNAKNIPMVVINHVYEEMKMYGKTIVSGGQGGMLSSDTVWIIGKSQEKDGTELLGYTFNINVEKSRYVREKSKIPIIVKFDGGISKFTGILEMALAAGEVIKPKNAWYQLADKSTGELLGSAVREKMTQTEDFLGVVLKRESFKQWIRDTYKIAQSKMIMDDVDLVDDEDDSED